MPSAGAPCRARAPRLPRKPKKINGMLSMPRMPRKLPLRGVPSAGALCAACRARAPRSVVPSAGAENVKKPKENQRKSKHVENAKKPAPARRAERGRLVRGVPSAGAENQRKSQKIEEMQRMLRNLPLRDDNVWMTSQVACVAAYSTLTRA